MEMDLKSFLCLPSLIIVTLSNSVVLSHETVPSNVPVVRFTTNDWPTNAS